MSDKKPKGKKKNSTDWKGLFLQIVSGVASGIISGVIVGIILRYI